MYQLKISVRNLVESMLMTGDIGSEMRFLSPERAEEGSRVHRLHQERRLEENGEYHREFYLKRDFDYDDIKVSVHGRADGVLPGHYIEEIKSTYLSAEALAAYENPLHWAQLKFYGYIYLKDKELDEIDLKLTYFNIETEQTYSYDQSFTEEELELFVQKVLKTYVELKRLYFRWKEKRNQSIVLSGFPFPDYRPGQREMAVNVYGTIRDRKHIYIQAPTGIGKTISAIFPAVKALREGRTDRIFYLTPKSTGKQIGEESVALLRQGGASLRSLTLTSKEKICFMDEVRCEADHCPYAKGYYDKIHGAMMDLLAHEDSMSREVMEAYAKKHEVCPFEFSLDLSLYADIIIGDYNYAFDPRVYLKRFFDEKTEQITFLVDEAHNLLDRARSMFSAQINATSFENLGEGFSSIEAEIARKARRVSQELRSLEALLPENRRMMTEDYDPLIYKAVEGFRGACEKYLQDEEEIRRKEKNKERDQEIQQALMDTYFNSLAFIRIAELYGRGYLTYAVSLGEEITYKLFCIHPAENLKAASTRADSIVFFSATLTPMDYYMDLYGASDEDYRMALPSPFPAENLTVYCDTRVDTRYRVREHSYWDISRNLDRMLQFKTGNYVAFFPSYVYMRKVHEVFMEEHAHKYDVSIQEPGLSETDRSLVLEQFDEKRERSFISFMVLGGVFAEGIDLKGDRLIGCAVIGLGYPQFDFERELIMDYYNNEKNEGFNYAYTYPGLNKITQAGGRVIRSETDQGILVLMDSRYRNRNIQQLLPSSWLPMTDISKLSMETTEH